MFLSLTSLIWLNTVVGRRTDIDDDVLVAMLEAILEAMLEDIELSTPISGT